MSHWLYHAVTSHLSHCRNFVVENFLPVSFAVAIIIAMAAPAPGKAVVSVVVGFCRAQHDATKTFWLAPS